MRSLKKKKLRHSVGFTPMTSDILELCSSNIQIKRVVSLKTRRSQFGNMDTKRFSCGIFVDLKMASDTVNHEILLHKLNHYGIRDIGARMAQSVSARPWCKRS